MRPLARHPLRHLLLVLLAWCTLPTWAATVSLAGVSYAGDYQSLAGRFPYSQRFTKSLAAQKSSPDRLLSQALAGTRIDNFTLQQGELTQLKGRDQAIAVALVVTNETVSAEHFGVGYKLFINLRAQALFFDFKSMTILRAYPISAATVDFLTSPPTDAQLEEHVRQLYVRGGDKPGVMLQFASRIATATLPEHVPRFLQVSKVSISPEARKELPEALRGTNTAETWLADQMGEAISSANNVPILPYSKGYAIGNSMAMRFADGTVFNLKIPEADYAFSVDLTQFKRVKTGESVAGVNYVYGSFVDVKLVEPLSNRSYLDTKLKNGENKQVPSMQTEIDDFPAYSSSVRRLFAKFSNVLAGKDDPELKPWLKSATSGVNIDSQISATQTVLQSCK